MLRAVSLSVGARRWSGPKILGRATDLVFAGVVGRQMRAATTQGTRPSTACGSTARAGVADMLSGMDFTPGEGIDFGAVGQVLLLALGGVRGRRAADAGGDAAVDPGDQPDRVPAARGRAGEAVAAAAVVLRPAASAARCSAGPRTTSTTSAQTLQQTMGQLINSLLTIVGVLAMMFWISPLLALVALVTVPVSVVVATRVGKRSQPHFVQQWKTTGKLNAHIEEMYTGHTLVKVFGRQEESARDFAEQNEALYEAGFKAQFNSGIMQPLMMFVVEPQLRAGRRRRRAAGRLRRAVHR